MNLCRRKWLPADSKRQEMKTTSLLAAMLLCGTMAYAQGNDPTIMTINGQKVSRSEFEYSYNKNNAEGVIDKKSVDDYVPLFINYKLKVEAAKAARLDTLSSFKNEFLTYRDQQVRPTFINDADIEAEAYKIYKETQTRVDSTGGMIKPSHILFMARQKDPQDKWDKAQQRADSVYQVLMAGGDFAALARKYSQDPGSARNGGQLPWLTKGQLIKEFEDVAFNMKKGEISKPVKTAFGYHIIRLDDKGSFFPYDSVKADIKRFIDQRGLREQLINQKLDSLAKADGPSTKPEDIVDRRLAEMEKTDPSLKYLVQEYHDGLLLYEISNRTVWDKAAKDEQGLQAFFKKHKKDYKWEQPRFKGIAYHTREQADIKAVRDAVKDLPFSQWADKLRKTFNNDSVLRIRVEKGIFKKGDNALVDKEVFGKDTTVKAMKTYPYDAVYGQKLKAPKEMDDVRGQVVADYQEYLEKQWVDQLRKQYSVEVDESVLKTVNHH